METLIYGRRNGEEEWQESLLYAGGKLLSETDIARVVHAATKDGFTAIRVARYDGSPPDFRKAVRPL